MQGTQSYRAQPKGTRGQGVQPPPVQTLGLWCWCCIKVQLGAAWATRLDFRMEVGHGAVTSFPGASKDAEQDNGTTQRLLFRGQGWVLPADASTEGFFKAAQRQLRSLPSSPR